MKWRCGYCLGTYEEPTVAVAPEGTAAVLRVTPTAWQADAPYATAAPKSAEEQVCIDTSKSASINRTTSVEGGDVY